MSGDLWVADVGNSLFEEIHYIPSGGRNLGWPIFDGPTPNMACSSPPTSTDPPVAVIDRLVEPGPASIISLAWYSGSSGPFNFGVTYQDSFFYLDFFHGFIRRLSFVGGSWQPAPPVPGQPSATDWASGYQGVTDGIQGADGAIYYVQRWNGELRRIFPSQSGAVLTVVSGDNQTANALMPLEHPLVVKLEDSAGAPIQGVTVTFTDTLGGGIATPQSVITNSQGEASAWFTLGLGLPSLRVLAPGAATATFNIRWRGIVVTPMPPSSVFIGVSHSQVSSALTVAVQPTNLTPTFPSGFGNIWTSILAPHPLLAVLDGLGLVSAPVPSMVTDPLHPSWTSTIPYSPSLSGVSLVFQAYAIDTSLWPGYQAIMVSNPAFLVLP